MSLIDFSADEDFNQLSKIQTETKPSNQSNSESINFDLIDIDFKVYIYLELTFPDLKKLLEF